MSDMAISGSANPYIASTYEATSNDRNTLDITDYFQLLAAQLANQDMTSPMSNGEMMQQMVQMAMVESVSSMTETMETMQAVSTQTYAASLVGQEITVAVVEDGVATGVKYGTVASVNFTSSTPVIMLDGDNKEYPLTYVLGMGQIPDPYKPTEPETDEDDGSVDNVDGAGGVEGGTTDEGSVPESTVPEDTTEDTTVTNTTIEDVVKDVLGGTTEEENTTENTTTEDTTTENSTAEEGTVG